ncbi:MAG: DNA methyltransferase, partial [Acidovorax sp.]|nr:DNA methyltransferase [Acidovorax sp.]
MDEVFGDGNFVSQINFKTTGGAGSPTGGTETLASVNNFILWYAKNGAAIKYRQPYRVKGDLSGGAAAYNKLDFFDAEERRPATDAERETVPNASRLFRWDNLTSQSSGGPQFFDVELDGKNIPVGKSGWKTTTSGMARLKKAKRVGLAGKTLSYVRYIVDFPVYPLNNSWDDTVTAGFASDKLYVVQTNPKVIERCILMATDPGDLVLDPTCGSGTTATVAEQWGRRWITIDTSRVALALARARIMGARYPFYLLADSREGQQKEAEITRTAPSTQPVQGNIRHGFVYERVPHITLKSIANNAEIDVIWDKWQARLEPLREQLNAARQVAWQEWEIPRAAEDAWDQATRTVFYSLKAEQALEGNASPAKLADHLRAINHNLKRNYTLQTLPQRPADPWPEDQAKLHAQWWQARIARQREIDASIAAKAEFEYLYDKPYENKKAVRVAGPFTVESLSPHRMLAVDENDELMDVAQERGAEYHARQSFPQMILDNLKTAGVQQAHKADRITFTSLTPWPGEGGVCAEGRYMEGEVEKRAGIFIGPEFGT